MKGDAKHVFRQLPGKAKRKPRATTPRVTAVELDHHRLGALAAADALIAACLAPASLPTTTTPYPPRPRGQRS
jgi:hypothetical protein